MTERKMIIKAIIEKYTSDYTSACMAERLAEEEREKKEANSFLEMNMRAFRMSKEEMNEVLEELYHEAEQIGTAFCYESEYFK